MRVAWRRPANARAAGERAEGDPQPLSRRPTPEAEGAAPVVPAQWLPEQRLDARRAEPDVALPAPREERVGIAGSTIAAP